MAHAYLNCLRWDAAVGAALKANYFCHCTGLPLNLVGIRDGFRVGRMEGGCQGARRSCRRSLYSHLLWHTLLWMLQIICLGNGSSHSSKIRSNNNCKMQNAEGKPQSTRTKLNNGKLLFFHRPAMVHSGGNSSLTSQLHIFIFLSVI